MIIYEDEVVGDDDDDGDDNNDNGGSTSDLKYKDTNIYEVQRAVAKRRKVANYSYDYNKSFAICFHVCIVYSCMAI